MPEASPDAPKRLEIKKYPNRRYYDATHSRHLTLEEIRSLIQQGYDLRVIDARTSADITAQVLTQIILELDSAKLDSLPVPLLVRLIRVNDQLIKDFIDKYFNQALQSFMAYQRQLEEQIRRAHGLPVMFPAVSAWTKAMLDPFTAAFGATPPAGTPSAAPSDHSAAGGPDLQQQVRDLQRQLAELKRPRPARKPGRRRRSKPRLA
ncbi:MAG TPA: polyhydroxyalkanoate synthesis regulator DNA-binding domain-containing protein [Candidatus Acidoferrum sp.]|nr:polyhydroxyalkanoate synthesis regulator DNA-binding domain-containing protein [Candidatus Acidoferrum sp.]